MRADAHAHFGLLGGLIFDFDVSLVYRNVFRKLDQMVAEMDELKG